MERIREDKRVFDLLRVYGYFRSRLMTEPFSTSVH
jgi:hypothetical protein